MERSKEVIGLAKCADCGEAIVAPNDGIPRWCIECSMKQDNKRR